MQNQSTGGDAGGPDSVAPLPMTFDRDEIRILRSALIARIERAEFVDCDPELALLRRLDPPSPD